MATELYAPRADAVDGGLFVETKATAAVTAALWTLLGLTRQEPRPWIPMTVLCGESGSGRTTLAQRFARATQRNASCDLIRERAPGADAEQAKRDAESLAYGARWAERMTRELGSCPQICGPVGWVPEHLIRQALLEAQKVHPAVRLQLALRPDKVGVSFGDALWRSPGNVTKHRTRRTSILMVDDADRLLSVPASRRRDVLDGIEAWEQVVRHSLAVVLIGSPALADVVAESRTTQVLRLPPLVGEEFANVCGMLFGTRDPATVAALHQTSGGLMGRLIHVARMQGLEPPYNVPRDKVFTLPALPPLI